MFAGDIPKPIPPQAFNVEVVIETPADKRDTAKKTKVRPIKISPSQIAVPSPGIPHQAPKQRVVKKLPQIVPLLPTTSHTNSIVRPIYAPIPKYKPDRVPPAPKENLVSRNLSKPSTIKNFKKHKTQFPSPRRKTPLPDIAPITPSTLGAPPISEPATAKAAVPTLPPQIDPRGENLWPSYPRRARQRGIEGQLLLRITVNANGQTSGIQVLKSSGHPVLDSAAVKAVKRWHFQPGRRGETPVKASMDMPVVFRLQ